MSGPRPQIIICTNFSSSPTAPALIRAALSTHYRLQAANSATLVVVIFPDS